MKKVEKKFGAILKELMRQTGLKEKEIANRINYDITSVSKWANGAKIPSKRNGEEIISALASYFAENGKLQSGEEEVRRELKQAWEHDMFYQEMNVKGHKTLSYIDSRKDFFELLGKVLGRMGAAEGGQAKLITSFDILKLLGEKYNELLKELPDMGINSIELTTCIDMNEAEKNPQLYCGTLLNTVSEYEKADVTIYQYEEGFPWILVAGDFFYAQLLYPYGEDFAACYIMEDEMVERFKTLCLESFDKADKILTSASPENLRKTNVQLDSYSSPRQRLFFNEAPAMLLPPEVMDNLIAESDNKGYEEYLRKLKKVFAEYTRRAKVDLIFFSSVISDYVMSGDLSLGNVAHKLTRKQIESHIEYLAECLEKNPEFNIYVMKDTTSVVEGFRRPPSIFIDNNAVTIENSQRKPNENYHISMYPKVIRFFEEYYDEMKNRPNCVKLTAEELRRYL